MSEGEDRIRKTVSFTHRQLGWSAGSVAAALIAIGPIKQSFYTREEGNAQAHQIEELKMSQDKQFAELKLFITAGQEEQVRKLERSNDKLVDRIRETENRSAKAEDRTNQRIDQLEGYLKQKSKITN